MSKKELTFIPFGSQYYRAPTPLPEKWEKDLTAFRDHGFNTVKLWAQWRWNMPAKDTFDFSDLDRLMDICASLGLKAVINIICDVGPAWFYREYPDSVMIASDGRVMHPQTTSWRQIGGAPGPCYHHQEGIDCRRRFVEETAKRYANHPALLCWDLWNEPELTCGILREATQDNMVCYCEHSVKAFRNWLKDRCDTLEALNRRWGRNYQCWEEIEPPRNAGTFNDMIDWREFFGQTLAAENSMRAAAVRAFDSEHPVMVHTVPLPHFNFMNTGSEEYLLAKEMDWFGNSVGSSPFPAVTTSSAAKGKWVINAEIHAIGGNTFSRPVVPSMEDFKKHILIPFGRGIKGFLFWQYKPECLGHESPAWGLVRPDGGDTPWLGYAKEINNALQKYTDRLLNAFPKKSRIAIINSSANQTFLWAISGGIDLHYQTLLGAFTALYEAQYDVDIITDHQLLDQGLADYDAVYAPLAYYMDGKTAQILKKFVEDGGTLISEALFGGLDADSGLHSEIIPGCGFDEIFGCREDLTVTASSFMNAYGEEWSSFEENRSAVRFTAKDGKTARGYFFHEALVPGDGEVVATFEDGSAAAVAHRYGKGCAVITGTLPGFMVGKYGCADSAEYIVSLMREFAGIAPNAKVEGGKRADVLWRDGKPAAIVLQTEQTENRSVTFADTALAGCTLVNAITGSRLSIDEQGFCSIPASEGFTELYIIE